MAAQGQTLQIQDDRMLFSILRTCAGGDGKTTFKLPQPKLGWIVAVSGTFPSDPSVFARSGRHVTARDSLGAGATVQSRMPKPERPQAIKERMLWRSEVFVRASRPVPVSRELAQRMRQAHLDARSAAIDALSAANRSRLDAAIASALSGRIRVYDVVLDMIPALTAGEASALLAISDGMARAFDERWAGARHDAPALEASRFLISVAITQDQIEAALARGPNALR